MILTKNIDIKIINHNLQHYKKLGYNVKYGDIINIPISHLSKGSHYIIDIKCNKCELIKSVKYQDYIKMTKNYTELYYCQSCVKSEKTTHTVKKKYGVSNPSQSNIIKKKKEKTNLKNWGVINVFQNNIIKNKICETNVKKYGFNHPNKSEIIKSKSLLTRIKNGKQIRPEYYTDYCLYRKNVLCVTRKYEKELFENWNGFDYYDNEYIKNYINLNSNNPNYPTIDHKISVFDGFNKNIDYNIIGNIDNLCLTKRSINSSKMNKSYDKFEKLNKYNEKL
jgi:hypothetical protein